MLKFEVFKHLLEVSKKNVIYFEELTLKAPVMVITDVVVMSRNTACTCEGRMNAALTTVKLALL